MHAKGVVLSERACFCLLSTFYNTPPSKNPSKNPCPYSNPYKVPSKNPSKKALPLKNLLRTLLRSVRLHDPLGVRPKHINIILTALAGQSSQRQTPTRPRDKRDKMAILLWNSTEKGRFVPGTGPILSGEGSHLSQGRCLFVPDTVPPKMFMFIGFFSCPIG